MASPWGTASILDPSHEADRRAFAARVAVSTGLDFYTVYGWESAEGGPFDNPLGVMEGGHLARFGTPNAAALQTIKRLQDPIYAALLSTAHKATPGSDAFSRASETVTEAAAISKSPWGPWGTSDPGLKDPRRAQYQKNIMQGIKGAMDKKVPAPEGTGPSWDKGGNVGGIFGHIPGVEQGHDAIAGVAGAAGATKDAAGAVAHALTWPFENWQRLLQMVGGILMLSAGIFLLARSQGISGAGTAAAAKGGFARGAAAA